MKRWGLLERSSERVTKSVLRTLCTRRRYLICEKTYQPIRTLTRPLAVDPAGKEHRPLAGEQLAMPQQELTPLLPHASKPSLLSLSRELLALAAPVVGRYLMYVGSNLLQILFAPRYSSASEDPDSLLAAVSLSNMFANVTCLSVLVGAAAAVDTLGSQYHGAGNTRAVGLTLQRSLCLLSLLAAALCPLWLSAEPLFLRLGVDARVCEVVGVLLRIRALSLPADVLRESFEAYLMSLGIMGPPLLGSLTSNLVQVLANLVFIAWGGDYRCLGLSFAISAYLGVAVQIAMSQPHPSVRNTLQPLSSDALSNWDELIELGVPSVLQICSEWWAFEILTVMASFLGTASVDAQTIVFQAIIICFMAPLGIGLAATTLVGTALGNGDVTLSKRIAGLAIGVVAVLEILIALSVLLFGGSFMTLFATDASVVSLARATVPCLAFYTVLDGLQGVAAGVLKGAGKQRLGATLNIIAFYAIGLPMAWFLCFSLGMGVRGLLLGVTFGTVFQATSLAYLLIFAQDHIFQPYIKLPI